MSTEILNSIFSLNLTGEYEESEKIFDLLPLNNKSTDDEYFNLNTKITEYDDSIEREVDFHLFQQTLSPSSPSSSSISSTSPFYIPLSPFIQVSNSPLDLVESELECELESEIWGNQIEKKVDTDIEPEIKNKKRGRKRKSTKIDNIIVGCEPIRKKSLDVNEDDIITIGIYTKAERREKIRRYKEKRRNHAKKRVLYKCRKRFADTRERVGGRFVKKSK